MPPLDEFAVQPQQLETGLKTLKKRQRNLMLLGITSTVLLTASIIGLFVQQDFIYSFFGLTSQVEQLHMPNSVDGSLASFGHQSDYFVNLLSWFGWLFLKLFASFFGAFIAVYLLRKIRFFYLRFQSFVLKFVGWLIAFMLIWGSLTYVQYDWNQGRNAEFQQLVQYDKQIQDSEISHYLADSDLAQPVQNYLLAQTALLHHPADRAAAIPYVQALIKAEKNDPQFLEYGFKPEQLWTMQNQLFQKTITPMAQSVTQQVAQADLLNSALRWVLLAVIALTAFLSLVLFLLASQIKNRAARIEHRIQ
ncbi:hypothetical protein [Acinetobacter sp. ANC 3813]|uniref:hypothetical protein n=1 Tax=Acinetobacter sp. ANC 3813 TaxID=1977873 RepID=UPI000A34C537|nr:hypothetical protein [Acinetobacter sp. ANC 3813]OTG91904.1 hypothetical protein B9T34_00710 [Acinetobacter sp. ANC 3813]